MQINALVSFNDWGHLAGTWGPQGIRRIMEYASDAGIKKLYWRMFGGGSANYPSKVASVLTGRYDFTKWDHPKDAVEIAREFGIEIHAWYTHYEESHGGIMVGETGVSDDNTSAIGVNNIDYVQTDRNGRKYFGTVDFFYDEIYDYKMKIMDEIIAYGFDGILLDYARHNGNPSCNAETGISRFGYNPEIVAAFKEKTGKDAFEIDPADEEWLRFKSEPHLRLVRETHKKMKAANSNAELSLMLWPVEYFTWGAIDVPTMTEEGLIDMLTAMSTKYTYHPREAKAQIEALKANTKSDKVRFMPGLCCYNFMSVNGLENFVKAVEDLGVEEVMMYESPSIVADKLMFSIGNINHGVPNYKRELKATKVDGEVDWTKVPVYDDFLVMKGNTDKPENKTSFQIAYDSQNIYVKFYCEDKHPESILPTVHNYENFYMNELGPRHYWGDWDSFNIFLDAHYSNEDFYHFKVEPDGLMAQQTRIDNEWEGKWNADVEIDSKGWGGVMTIPLSTMDVEKPGKMRINIVRTLREKPAEVSSGVASGMYVSATYSQEITCWFKTWPYTMQPEAMGNIVFE